MTGGILCPVCDDDTQSRGRSQRGSLPDETLIYVIATNIKFWNPTDLKMIFTTAPLKDDANENQEESEVLWWVDA